MALSKSKIAQHRSNIDDFLLAALFQEGQEGDGEKDLPCNIDFEL
jgi:hypothetical protein